MKDFLAAIGVVTVMLIVGFAVICLKDFIDESIRKLKLKHKQKHRFDKPPIAKCYCIDCCYHDIESGKCHRLNEWYTTDGWFCRDAEPRKN